MSAFVQRIRWIVAAITVALTPAALVTLWSLLVAAYEVSFWLSPFSIGFAAMFALMRVFHRRRFAQFWATMEHEFTHALFAWLTFVRVTELRTGDGTRLFGGSAVGYVVLQGENWLISLAPYFFPTASAAVMLATWTFAEVPSVASKAILGAATAWSVLSTWHETHAGQSDIKSAGPHLAWCFLPGANILCYGTVMAYALGGWDLAWGYAAAVPIITLEWLNQVL